jgi:hypothetical protein
VRKQDRQIVSFIQRQTEGTMGKALGIKPWRISSQTEEAPPGDIRQRFLQSDFDRRLHHLAMLDRQPGFKPYLTCFDPLMYLVTTNRFRWALYEWARKRGVDQLELKLARDPDAIDIRGRSGLLLAFTAYGIGLGLPALWTLLRLDHATPAIYLQNSAMSLSVVLMASSWFYLAVVARRGFPAAEPIGSYTVDIATRKMLSL